MWVDTEYFKASFAKAPSIPAGCTYRVLLTHGPGASDVGLVYTSFKGLGNLTAREAGTVFMVAENAQYWPEVLTVRDLIRDGAIGDVITARAATFFPALGDFYGGDKPSGNLTCSDSSEASHTTPGAELPGFMLSNSV